ncbi:MAG: hypothetical protein ACT4TC_05920 [Myxococcaceae bacterium]
MAVLTPRAGRTALILAIALGALFGIGVGYRLYRSAHSEEVPAAALTPSPALATSTADAAVESAPAPFVIDPEEDQPDDKSPAASGKSLGRFMGRKASVYVDGKPVGMLTFGELPVGLKPVWITEEISATMTRGDSDGGGVATTQARRYRFTDYLKAVGVTVAAIKMIHVYGAKASDVIIASGEELRSAKGQGFYFRFGSETYGKALPVVPERFGNGHSPDKITGVCVYISKPAPVLIRNKGLAFDGKLVDGIPYYGEPIHGGARVYFDNRLAVIVKRRDLAGDNDNLDPKWKLQELLTERGFSGKRVVEGWLVANEKRGRKFSAEQLATAVLVAVPQTKPYLQLGEEKIRFSVLALHTQPVTQEDLSLMAPRSDIGEDALPDEKDDAPSPEDGF